MLSNENVTGRGRITESVKHQGRLTLKSMSCTDYMDSNLVNSFSLSVSFFQFCKIELKILYLFGSLWARNEISGKYLAYGQTKLPLPLLLMKLDLGEACLLFYFPRYCSTPFLSAFLSCVFLAGACPLPPWDPDSWGSSCLPSSHLMKSFSVSHDPLLPLLLNQLTV